MPLKPTHLTLKSGRRFEYRVIGQDDADGAYSFRWSRSLGFDAGIARKPRGPLRQQIDGRDDDCPNRDHSRCFYELYKPGSETAE
jgi:hypothetical protein